MSGKEVSKTPKVRSPGQEDSESLEVRGDKSPTTYPSASERLNNDILGGMGCGRDVAAG